MQVAQPLLSTEALVIDLWFAEGQHFLKKLVQNQTAFTSALNAGWNDLVIELVGIARGPNFHCFGRQGRAGTTFVTTRRQPDQPVLALGYGSSFSLEASTYSRLLTYSHSLDPFLPVVQPQSSCTVSDGRGRAFSQVRGSSASFWCLSSVGCQWIGGSLQQFRRRGRPCCIGVV